MTTGPSRQSTLATDRLVTTSVTAHSATGDTVTTTTYEYGSTAITASFLDGQPKSVRGTAVADMTYDYGTHTLNGGGLTTKTTTASGLVTTTYKDLLGRTAKVVSDANGTTTYVYHPLTAAPGSRGKLASVTDADAVTVAYGYNAMGERTTTSKSIVLADSSTATQITTNRSDVVANVTLHGINLDVCRRQTQTIQSTGVAPITVAESYASINGLVSGSRTLDGDALTVSTYPAPATGIATRTTVHPDGTSSVQTTTHGLLTEDLTKSTTGTAIAGKSYTYDALQRQLTVTDSRTGTSTNSSFTEAGQPLATTNARGDVTTRTNDRFGRTIQTTLPDNSLTFTSYYPTGKIKAQWGSQTNPIFNIYDEQNRLTTLRTYQNLTAEPQLATPGFAATSWVYSTTTGQLISKRDNDNKATGYGYTAAGRLSTRTWARGVTTTYTYNQGLLALTDYSDTTPDVAITYDALGRQSTVTQPNQSQIAYTYNPADLALDTETIRYDVNHDGTTDLTRVLDRHNRSLGRDMGWALRAGTTTESQADYAYDPATGRLASVADASSSFAYAYVDRN